MGKQTGIAWTDHTFNPWIGCTKVSIGCANCYAERENSFRKWVPEGWGPGRPRKRTSEANWREPIKWARQAVADGVLRRVFIASLADVLDTEVPGEWRQDLWNLVDEIGSINQGSAGLEVMLLTKRSDHFNLLPADWLRLAPDHVRLGACAGIYASAVPGKDCSATIARRNCKRSKSWEHTNYLSGCRNCNPWLYCRNARHIQSRRHG